MSADNATAATPAASTAPVQEAAVFVYGNQEFPAIKAEFSRGDNKGRPLLVLNIPKTDTAALDRLRTAIGEERFNAKVLEFLREAAHEASEEAFNPETSELDDSKHDIAFDDYFNPATRKASGPSKADLLKQLAASYGLINPLVKKLTSGTISEDEQNALSRLVLEAEDIQAKLEKKTRKGKAAA